MDSDQYARSEKAKATLKASDWVIARALEASVMGAEWCAWRDTVRQIAETGEGVIPPEPPRGKANPHMQAPVDVPMPEFLKDAVPPEVVDILSEHGLSPHDSYERINDVLAERFMHYKQREEIARAHRAPFEGRGAVDWLKKAEAVESGVNWNRGRRAETI